MLKKNMLRFDLRNQKLYPRFLDSQNKIWQNIATELITLYETGCGSSREELIELVEPILNAARSPLIAKGLNKLLLDRCTFQEVEVELELFRFKVFTIAAQRFCQHEPGGMNNLETYRKRVADSVAMESDALSSRLYSDLPDRHVLLSFKRIKPEQLLHRYNMAQAQGPLYWADGLTIEIEEPDVGKRRKFFQRLKFFRLLARLFQTQAGKFSIQLDGPLSLFDSSRAYGIQLACFLPSVCALNRWSIQANVRIDNGSFVTLELDQNSGLKSHFTQTNTYIPEEFERFASQFNALAQKDRKEDQWKMGKTPTLLHLGAQQWVVPDFSFRHANGQVVHLELFHRWHAGLLLQRLDHLQNVERPLALGVDRFLSKDPSIQARLKESKWFQEHGFPFNGFPPVKRVVDCLNGFLPCP